MIKMKNKITIFTNVSIIQEKLTEFDLLIAPLTPDEENLSESEFDEIYLLANSILLSALSH